jgi:hypothetical protein
MMLRNLATILTLSNLVGNAFAFDPKIDLKDGVILAQGRCRQPPSPEMHPCVAVRSGSNLYIVAFDKKGILYVDQANELKEDYNKEDLRRVWTREDKLV